MDNNQPAYIDTRQAAQHLGLSWRTLEKFRLTGQGPRYYKFGRRVLYRLDEVVGWANSCKRCSTADPGQAQ